MNFLTTIWALSAITLFGVIIFAYRQRSHMTSPKQIPEDFNAFIHEALSHLAVHATSVAGTAKPHAHRVVAQILSLIHSTQTKFTEQVFGKINKERGKTATFFLKYIAEHKETTRGTQDQKDGYQK